MSRRLIALIVANVLVVTVLLVGTIVVNRHLDRHIAAKQRSYQACVIATKPKLVKKKCGWSSLSQQKDAVLYGDAFAVVALGLADFLLYAVRPLRT